MPLQVSANKKDAAKNEIHLLHAVDRITKRIYGYHFLGFQCFSFYKSRKADDSTCYEFTAAVIRYPVGFVYCPVV